MSASELRTATNISSSVNKIMSLDGNFGIGAKVSGLAASPHGIRYRSCKNGSVHEVTIGYDPDEQTYVRFNAQLSDGKTASIYDVTSIAIKEGHITADDWTEVVLFGESDEHDTVAEPIGIGRAVERSFIATSIFRRFARFSPGVRVSIDVAMTKGGGKDATGQTRQLRVLEDVLERLGGSEIVNDPLSDVQVRYIHDPRHESSAHTLSARANPATSSTTFCAIVYKDERYDFRTQKVWSAAAPLFGIPFGSKVLTIEVLLPNSLALPNQYRDALTLRDDRSPLTVEYFAPLVRELMPGWVKEIIRQESPDGADDLNDLQADLQALLDELRVPTKVLERSSAAPSKAIQSDTGTAQPEKVSLQSEQEEEKIGTGEPKKTKSDRASKSKIRLAPLGAVPSKLSQALERAPEIKILVDPADINEREMKGKAAKFYQDVQTLFVNGLYPAVDKMMLELSAEIPEKVDSEVYRQSAIQASRRSLAYRVGKATCFALAKRLVDDWTQEDMEKATSPESLSLAADDFRQSISSAKKWMRDETKRIMSTELTSG